MEGRSRNSERAEDCVWSECPRCSGHYTSCGVAAVSVDGLTACIGRAFYSGAHRRCAHRCQIPRAGSGKYGTYGTYGAGVTAMEPA